MFCHTEPFFGGRGGIIMTHLRFLAIFSVSFSLISAVACSEQTALVTDRLAPHAVLDSVPLVVLGSETDPIHNVAGALFIGDTLVLTDRSTFTLRFYDRASGHRLRVVGGQGEGPGEFLSIGRPQRAAGRLYVWDSRLVRLTTFTFDGDLQGSVRIVPIEPYPAANVVGVFEDGSSLVALTEPFDVASRVLEPTIQRRLGVLARYDTEGRFVDSLGTYRLSERYVEPYGHGGERGGGLPMFGRRSAVGAMAEQYYVLDNIESGIEVFSASGMHMGALGPNVALPKVNVTNADLEQGKLRVSAVVRSAYDAGYIRTPQYFPWYGWSGRRFLSPMTVAAANELWILNYGGVRSSGPVWSVYSPDGMEMGLVASPDEVRILATDGRFAAVLNWGEFEVERVEVREIVQQNVGRVRDVR